MLDKVDIDEKQCHMTKINQKYYLLPDEQQPHRTVKSNRFITKVMFMVAVARQRWDNSSKPVLCWQE